MRQAGVVNPFVEAGEAPRSLPETSDFTGGAWPAAYWRRRWAGTPWVFRASGSRVILDVRTELGMGADGRRIWTPAVMDAVWQRVTATGITATRPSARIENGARVPLDWLRLALWITYDAHNPLSETELPLRVLSPMAGVELPAPDDHAVTQVQLNTSDLAVDPFRRVYTAPEERVEGKSPRRTSSGKGKWLLGGIAALLLLGGGKGEGGG